MSKINVIIAEVESGKRNLSEEMAPLYHEQDGEYYIVHNVEGTDIDVYFPEQDHVKDMRNKFEQGEITDEELSDYIGEMNGLDDMYDYDVVVAYEDAEKGVIFVNAEGAV